ncbi:MAG: hypothetical protein KKA90_04195 [Nanoarchaeota archaeon]|nr:hypothetical protein [Nanoarchaeota archaeon]
MKSIVLGFLVATVALMGGALACGEKDIQFVASLEDSQYVMEKSSCTELYFPSNGESFLLEEADVLVTDHQAKHILEYYLRETYGPDAAITEGETEVPGHEDHHHGHGNPQLSHGHYAWSFNVVVPGMMDGKAFPLFVDMQSGDVYGIGCGFGAGDVVFHPDLADYPDDDQSDEAYHMDDQEELHAAWDLSTMWGFLTQFWR